MSDHSISNELTQLKQSATELLIVCSAPVLLLKDKNLVDKAKEMGELPSIVELSATIQKTTEAHSAKLASISKKHAKWKHPPKTPDQYMKHFNVGNMYIELTQDMYEVTTPAAIDLIEKLEKVADEGLQPALSEAKSKLISTTPKEVDHE